MRVRERPGHPSLFDWLDRTEARVVAQNAALEHERQAGRGAKRPAPWTRDRGRASEIQKLIRHRHGGPCDTDDGALYLKAALPHLIRLHAGPALLGKVLGWAKTWLPGLPAESVVCEVDVDEVTNAKLLKADTVARLLGVTREERETLRFRTIGAVDFTRRQRLADRKRKDAAYQAAKRLQAGATPRSQSNIAKAKALGISLSTYKRRLKQGLGVEAPAVREPISSAIVRSTYNPLRDRVTVSEQTAPGPARKARPSRSVGADGHSPRSIPKIVRTAEPLPPPLSEGRGCRHPDFFEETLSLGTAAQSVIDAYTGGRMPPEVIRAVHAAQRVRLLQQEDVAHQIGVSPPQLSNALKGRFGLSPRAAANLKEWLAAA
jgi:hypothetical protein